MLFKRKRNLKAGLNVVFNLGSNAIEKSFDELLNLRVVLATEMQKIILDRKNHFKKPIINKDLDVRIAVYTLCFTSLLLKDNEMKDYFHEYYKQQGSTDRLFINKVSETINRHYPEYYDRYNAFIDSKDASSLIPTIGALICYDDPNSILNFNMTDYITFSNLFTQQYQTIIKTYKVVDDKYSGQIGRQ